MVVGNARRHDRRQPNNLARFLGNGIIRLAVFCLSMYEARYDARYPCSRPRLSQL
jgi:hypothetical protein